MLDKAVILLSGGIDSTVLLYSLANHFECYPLTVLYGQRHAKEAVAARNVCEALSPQMLNRWKCVNLEILGQILPSALTGTEDIPHGHYQAESMKSTVVPNRNMILLAIAGGYAQGVGAKHLFYAAHSGDHAIYPDCRPAFVQSCTSTLRLATGWQADDGVKLVAPFVNYTKAQIVKQGSSLAVPFHLTWSCYEGKEIHCGVCGTCVERKEAFKLAGVQDPTKYVAEILSQNFD